MEVKHQGIIKQQDKQNFTIRVKIKAGNISSTQMIKISDIANRYGRGYVGLTTRLSIEIPWIKYENLMDVKHELALVGLVPGGTGPTVRPLVACKGSLCAHGLVDTQSICEKLDEKFYAQELPAKFKIGISGCPNNCAKVQLNDIGFMGQYQPKLDSSICVGCECKACVSICKINAIEVLDGKSKIDHIKCVNCGKCAKVCRAKAISVEVQGIAVYVGGKFGRKYRLGDRVDEIFSVEEIYEFTEKIIEYYKENANKGERFADMVERIGLGELM